MEFSIEHIVITLGYIGICSLMISNGIIGFPSSQILYIISGFFISTGDLNLALVSIIGALGNTIGNIILYEAVRAKGLSYITRFKIFPEREVRKVQIAVSKRGSWFIFAGKLLPAIKVFIPIVAGIGKMNRTIYIAIILISSYIWSLIFIAIGFYFGKNTDFLGVYVLVLIAISLIIVGIFYRYINSQGVLREVE